MSIKSDIELAERRIRASGKSVADWLRHHEISVQTWHGWKNGATPRTERWTYVQGLIDRLPEIVEK